MADLLELPWTLPVYSLPRRKILVVYNSSVAWTQASCEYYCDQRGIPRENIVGVPAGVGNIWLGSSGTGYNLTGAQIDAVLFPVAEALDKGGHCAIILGPAFPSQLRFRDYNPVDGSLDTGSTFASYVSMSMALFMSCARFISKTRKAGWPLGGDGGGQAGDIQQINPDTGLPLISRLVRLLPPLLLDTTPLGGGLPSGAVELRTLPEQPVAHFPYPTRQQQKERWTTAQNTVGVGILGWSPGFTSGVTSLPAETAIGIKALIDRATAVMAKVDAAANRAKPHLVGLRAVGGAFMPLAVSQAYYRLLVEWGINADYFYAYDSQPAGDNDPPFSGAWGNATTMAAGISPPYEYFCLLGASQNGTPGWYSNDGLNFDGNHVAMEGAHTRLSGESYPYIYNPYSISRDIAVAGLVDTKHQSGESANRVLTDHAMLLRGLSYLEATCWRYPNDNSYAVPVGDPLYAPYGRRSSFIVNGELTDEDAVPPGANPNNLSFADIPGVASGATATFSVMLAGMFTPLPIAVSWGAEWSVTSASAGFTKERGTIAPNVTLWVRHTAGAAGSTTSKVYVGTASATLTSTTF